MGIRRAGIAVLVFVVLFAFAPRAFAAAPVVNVASATFTVGSPGTIQIDASATPTPTVTKSGALPSGVTFTDNGNGTATVAGTPAAGTAGAYPITVTATNTDGTDSKDFTLTVLAAAATPTPIPTAAPVLARAGTCRTLNANQVATTKFVRGERFFVKGVLPGVRTLRILFNGGVSIGSDGADDGGTYTVAARIPTNAPLGANTVVAKGFAGAVPVSATCAINVLAGKILLSSATLPRTGMPTSVLIALGVTMVELGAGLLLFADRRRAVPVVGPYIDRLIRRLES